MEMIDKYNRWLQKATLDQDLIKELKFYTKDEIEDAFYKNLEFGTGGLRGVIGAGTNRMNVYTVAKATQGLANYLIKVFNKEDRKVAISRDTRLKSDLFANITAQVFAGNGFKVYIYPNVSPVPMLSFATRHLNCCAGVMITASHNPSKYNGYKVYGSDGCQITTEAASFILKEIEAIDEFIDVRFADFDKAFDEEKIQYIKPSVTTEFLRHVKKQSFLGNEQIDKSILIVYSPLNGSGLIPVTRVLKEMGFTNINVVKEQEFPNGYFPTCPYPNPEIKEALQIGLEYCKKFDADLMLATDPDCDRVGIAVKNSDGEHILLTGNEVGMLLLDYICSRRIELGTMPDRPVVVKTIVTIDMADRIAARYGCEVRNVLTGFKFIGEQIGLLEKEGRQNDYIFGFEESYGYLSGTYVRDKDGVNGATLIVEMFAYYINKGVSLIDKLNSLYKEYGYTKNSLKSYEFDGPTGMNKMNKLMDSLRSITTIGSFKILHKDDFNLGLYGLPKSNVLKFYLENNCSFVVRPSGTEPKIKLYTSVSSDNEKEVAIIERSIVEAFDYLMQKQQ